MKERPILMSAPMVRAILTGRKTQTRRVVTPQPRFHADGGPGWYPDGDAKRRKHYSHFMRGMPEDFSPYGAPGDRLFVREAWRAPKSWDDTPPRGINDIERLSYIANEITIPPGYGRYRHARFMPRAFCRLVLELTAVRVERLQEISGADAKDEGFHFPLAPNDTALYWYERLWDSLNAKRGFGWDANPWCWVLTFKRIEEARKAA